MKKTIGQRCSIFIDPRGMNRLPILIENAENKGNFKMLIRKYLRETDLKIIKTFIVGYHLIGINLLIPNEHFILLNF